MHPVIRVMQARLRRLMGRLEQPVSDKEIDDAEAAARRAGEGPTNGNVRGGARIRPLPPSEKTEPDRGCHSL
jgi:hypothetical protein